MSFRQLPETSPGVTLLQRSLDRGRLSHAYLFQGGSLPELESVARIFAKTLNCQGPAAGRSGLNLDSCDSCLSCRKVDSGNHPDVHWVRPESKLRVITIDQIRQLMHDIYLKPAEARYKAAIIVDAERLNVHAANAFLKTLEEPPANSIILLLSTDPQRILETILSRCLRLSFTTGSAPQLSPARAEWLRSFAELASTNNAGLFARYQLLDVILSELGKVKEKLEQELRSRSPLEQYADAENKIKERWEDELTAAVEAEYRRERNEILSAIQTWLRDVWLTALDAGQDLLQFPELATATAAVASRLSAQDAQANLAALDDLQRLLGSNVQEALSLEVSLLKLNL